jgi:hypothetical protein
MLQAKQPIEQATRNDFKAIFRELGRLHRMGYHTKCKKMNNTTIVIVEKAA